MWGHAKAYEKIISGSDSSASPQKKDYVDVESGRLIAI
jgi:hypothetical protein